MSTELTPEQAAEAFYVNTSNDDIASATREILHTDGPEPNDHTARVHSLAIENTKAARELGMSGPEFATVLRATKRALGLDDAAHADMQSKTRAALRSEFGEHADTALGAAMDLAKRNSNVAKMLTRGGGNDPQVVLAFARAAMRQRKQA